MATPRLSKSKLARDPSKRAVVYVYCAPAEKALLERAAAQRVSHVAGAKFPLHSYVLQAALAEARRELGPAEENGERRP